ncbi:MAG: DUF2007 domain-containing protein [Candidatus Aminicenantes bacterium]|nr:DUF2007 domain-containing protein [Candidatus Aminicenantes bacterium]
MPEKLITIATFSRVMEAHLSKARLESGGIECFLADEYIVIMNWLYSDAVGGVKLRVKASDVQRAVEILRQEPASTDSGFAKDGFCCPKCHSSDVYYEKYWRRAVFISWILLTVPFPFLKRRWKCRECGYQWKV